jgi:hypothetical protein
MAQLKLNHEIINRGDMHRIMRELNALDDFFVGAKARTPGTSVQMPKTSKILEQLASCLRKATVRLSRWNLNG